MMNILCHLGIHKMGPVERQMGYYGMGLEWFEVCGCIKCGTVWDRLEWKTGKQDKWKKQDKC